MNSSPYPGPGAPGLRQPSQAAYGRPNPAPVLVAIPERTRQRRWTVLLRLALAVPMVVVVLFLGMVTGILVVLGWFSGVVTGRVPAFVRQMVAGYLRMSLRLGAYTLLLTDRYPPFSMEDDPDYPARMAVPVATKMSRMSVLLRYLLAVPAILLASLVQLGLATFAVLIWLIVLVTGWLPPVMHLAYGGALRFQIRLAAYALLLVPKYPGGLFGDSDYSRPPAPMFESPAPGVADDAEPLVPEHSIWSLRLEGGAKTVLVLAILLGLPFFIGPAVDAVHLREVQDRNAVVQTDNTLGSELAQYDVTYDNCVPLPAAVTCEEQADGELSAQLDAAIASLRSQRGSGVAPAVVSAVINAARTAAQETSAVASAGANPADYDNLVNLTGVSQGLATLEAAQNQLKVALTATVPSTS